MNQLRKQMSRIANVALVSAGLLAVAGEVAAKKIPGQQAPFKKAADSPKQAKGLKAVLDGNKISCGNKVLEFCHDGVFKYYADGRMVATITMPFTIVDAKTNKRLHWLETPKNWPKEFYVLDQCGMIKRDGKDVYRKVFQKDGKTAECLTSVELEEDGRIRISYNWTQFESDTFKLKPSTIMFGMPTAALRGSQINIDGKANVIPEKKTGVMLETRRFKEVDLFGNKIAKSARIFPTESCSSFFVDVRTTGSMIRFQPKRGNTCSLLIDIRKAVKKKQSKHTRAGIDFISIENLELPDYSSSPNLTMNPSFEQGLKGYWWESRMVRYTGPETWQKKPYIIDESTARFGKKSLKLLTRKKSGADYRTVGFPIRTNPVPLSPGTYTFSFYAKGEAGEEQRISLWFPNAAWHGNQFLPVSGARKMFYLSPEWKRYSFTFKLPYSMPLCAKMGADSKSGTSHVWLDGLQLEAGDKATEFSTRPAESRLLTSQPDNFLSIDDNINARLAITAKPNEVGKVKVLVTNFFDEEIVNQQFDFKCDSDGKAEVALPLNGKTAPGVYVVKSEFELADGSKTHDFHRFSVMEFLENKHRLKNMFADDYSTPAGRFDFKRMLDRWKKIGIGSKNHMHLWDKVVWDTYRQYGVEPTDASMASWIRPYINGKSQLQGFCLRDPLYPNWGLREDDPKILMKDFHLDGPGEPTDEYLERFSNVVAKIAKAYPWVPMWTFGGEVYAKRRPEWWAKEGTEEAGYRNFAKILKAFCKGVKQANPNAMIYQDAPCNMTPEGGIAETDHLLKEVNKLGGVKFDMIGMHPYRKTPESPDLDADTERLIKVMKKHGYDDTPMFWPEGMHFGPYSIPQWGIESASWLPPRAWYYGTLSYDMGWSEKISAAWRARSWLIALKYQDRVKSFQAGGFINNADMDLDLIPFASQKIPNTLGHLLGDAVFKKDIRFAPYVRCYIFEDKQKRPVAAVWGHHPRLDAGTMDSPTAEADFGGQLESVFDLMGGKRQVVDGGNGKSQFPVTSFPAFFRGKPGSLAKFIKTFNTAGLISGEGISPILLSGKPVSPEELGITAKNYLSSPFNGSIKCAGKTIPLHVGISTTAVVKAPLPVPLQAGKIVKENLPLELKSNDRTFATDVSFNGFICKKAVNPIVVDGKTDDWQDMPAIQLKNRSLSKGVRHVDDKDFSGAFKIAWTEKGIYVMAEITDDKFVHKEFERPENRWCNDCLQIYFDTFCDAALKQQRGYDENDYDYSVDPSADGTKAHVFRRRTPDPQLGLATQAPSDKTIANDIPCAFRKTENGYVYEVFFPAKYLLPIKLEKGVVTGFGLFVADTDDPNKEYPRRVESGLTITPPGTGCYNAPHLYPKMLLWD